MNNIIFILSCERDRHNGWNAAARETYLKTWGKLIPHKFLIGTKSGPHKFPKSKRLDDELYVDADDTYQGLAHKVRAAYRWAEGRYDYIFQAMIDTYVAVPRLLSSGFEKQDYIGCGINVNPTYAGGGSGYWLSRRAYKFLAATTDNPPLPIWDDLWIGTALRAGGIPLYTDLRYWTDAHLVEGVLHGGVGAFPFWRQNIWDTGIITAHLGRGTHQYQPMWMQECHRSFLLWARGGYSLEVPEQLKLTPDHHERQANPGKVVSS